MLYIPPPLDINREYTITCKDCLAVFVTRCPSAERCPICRVPARKRQTIKANAKRQAKRKAAHSQHPVAVRRTSPRLKVGP